MLRRRRCDDEHAGRPAQQVGPLLEGESSAMKFSLSEFSIATPPFNFLPPVREVQRIRTMSVKPMMF
jgi:hypothetical protein